MLPLYCCLKNLAHIYAFYSLKSNEAIDLLNEAIILPNADKKYCGKLQN